MKPFVMGLLLAALSGLALFKSHDESDLGKVDAESFRQGSVAEFAGCIQRSDFTHLRPRELGVAVLLAAEGYLSAFSVPVGIILPPRAQEQVGRIGTRPIIARMQDTLAKWDFAIVDEPRRPMSVTRIERPIARSVNAGEPFPASAKHWIVRMQGAIPADFLPEAFLECFGKTFGGRVGDGNCRVHSVSLFDCVPSPRLVSTVRGQLRSDSQVLEISAT